MHYSILDSRNSIPFFSTFHFPSLSNFNPPFEFGIHVSTELTATAVTELIVIVTNNSRNKNLESDIITRILKWCDSNLLVFPFSPRKMHHHVPYRSFVYLTIRNIVTKTPQNHLACSRNHLIPSKTWCSILCFHCVFSTSMPQSNQAPLPSPQLVSLLCICII